MDKTACFLSLPPLFIEDEIEIGKYKVHLINLRASPKNPNCLVRHSRMLSCHMFVGPHQQKDPQKYPRNNLMPPINDAI